MSVVRCHRCGVRLPWTGTSLARVGLRADGLLCIPCLRRQLEAYRAAEAEQVPA
jgi:hypothetical protein